MKENKKLYNFITIKDKMYIGKNFSVFGFLNADYLAPRSAQWCQHWPILPLGVISRSLLGTIGVTDRKVVD